VNIGQNKIKIKIKEEEEKKISFLIIPVCALCDTAASSKHDFR